MPTFKVSYPKLHFLNKISEQAARFKSSGEESREGKDLFDGESLSNKAGGPEREHECRFRRREHR